MDLTKNDGQCSTCNFGFYLKQSSCLSCQVLYCKQCYTSPSSCDTCFQGYIFNSAKVKCLPCAVTCKSCKPSDISQCVGCIGGYYETVINAKTKCAQCFSNCASCSNGTQCSECNQGYSLSKDSTKCIVSCAPECATCDETDPTKCLTCYSGTTLNQSKSTCQSTVSICNSTKSCSACPSAYVIYQSQCFQCQYTDTNCIACSYDSLETCSMCSYGFYLQSGQCLKCQTNCSYCVGQGKCLKCSNGYWLDKKFGSSTGICKTCDSSCKTCDSNPLLCTSCNEGYNLTGSYFVSIYNIVLQTRFDMDYDVVFDILDSFLQWIVNKVNAGNGEGQVFTTQQIVIKQITIGSIIINSTVSLNNPTNLNLIVQDFIKAISSGSEMVDGYIIGGSVQGSIEPAVDDNTETSNPSESSSSLGLILGISIPLGVIILISVIVIAVKINQKKKQISNEENGKSGFHQQTQGNFTADEIQKSQKI